MYSVLLVAEGFSGIKFRQTFVIKSKDLGLGQGLKKAKELDIEVNRNLSNFYFSFSSGVFKY